jgi:hypothetical protein
MTHECGVCGSDRRFRGRLISYSPEQDQRPGTPASALSILLVCLKSPSSGTDVLCGSMIRADEPHHGPIAESATYPTSYSRLTVPD